MKIFDESAFPLGAHFNLPKSGTVFRSAPATADFMANKTAHGHADDLISTLYLAFAGRGAFRPGDE